MIRMCVRTSSQRARRSARELEGARESSRKLERARESSRELEGELEGELERKLEIDIEGVRAGAGSSTENPITGDSSGERPSRKSTETLNNFFVARIRGTYRQPNVTGCTRINWQAYVCGAYIGCQCSHLGSHTPSAYSAFVRAAAPRDVAEFARRPRAYAYVQICPTKITHGWAIHTRLEC